MRMTRVAVAAAVVALLWAVPADAAPMPQLPNLSPRRPYNVYVGDGLALDGKVLRFTATAENRGAYALDIVAQPSGADGTAQIGGQCVSWTGPACAGRVPIQGFVYDPAHEHFHLQDFAVYELRRVDPNGIPDMSPEGLVVSGRKVSFCLIDSEPNQEDTAFTGLLPVRRYFTCAEEAQGISAGWADVYDAGLSGQELPIQDVAEGRYALVVTIDPDHLLQESTRLDNVASRIIELKRYGGYTEARVID
jgi:hypothetical protein